MGVGGGLGEEEVELGVELGGVVPLLDHPVVGEGDEGVVADADQAADLAALHLPDHLHHGGSGGREFGLLDAPDLADLTAVLGVGDGASAREEVGLLAVLAAALPVALAGDGAVSGTGLADVAGGGAEVDHGQAVLDALRVVLDAPGVPGHGLRRAGEGAGDLDDLLGGDAADGGGAGRRILGGLGLDLLPAGGVGGEVVLVGEPFGDDDVQYGGEEGRVGARLQGDVDVGGPGDGGLARVDDDEARPAVPGSPDVLGHHGEALAHVGAGDEQAVGEEDVGEGVAGPVDAEGELVGTGRADHAEAAVVVDVPGLEGDPGELAHQISLLGEEAGAAEEPEGVVAVGPLDALDLGDGEVERLVPGDLAELLVAGAAHERGGESVGVVDLLVGVDALGAEPHPVDVVVAGFDAEDLAAAVHPQIHPALDAAEAAVGGDERLAVLVGVPLVGRDAARVPEGAGAGRGEGRVERDEGAAVGGGSRFRGHLKPFFTWER